MAESELATRPGQMIDYIKQVFITGDVSCIGKKWPKEIAEQKPEFAVVHVQGLHSADDPDYISRGLGNLYLFRDHSAVQQFDRYLNTGYRQIRAGHDSIVGRSEADGFIRNTFGEQPTARRQFYREDGTRDISQQRTGFLLTRFRIHGKEMTFVNINLHSVPFEDVNEIVEQVQVTKAARKRNEEIETLLRELEAEGLRDDAIIVGGAFNAQLHETDLLTYLAKTQMVQTVAKKDDSGKVEAIEQYDRHGRVSSIFSSKNSHFQEQSAHS
ncbi:hypothetical protein OSTOST_12389 [Ostertagia ostertagi]